MSHSGLIHFLLVSGNGTAILPCPYACDKHAINPACNGMIHNRLSAAYSVAIESSSRDGAFALLQTQMAPGGRLCILADGNLEPLTLQPAFHEKELRIIGSSDGEDYQGYATWFWTHAQSMSW